MWETVIGLEVHAQMMTEAKLFSRSGAKSSGEGPNTNIDYLDLGLPGALPVLNFACIEQGVKSGLALDCKIQEFSMFDRKHYFYPDLPTGYQITQFYYPIATGGVIEIKGKKIRINRIHIEQDAGKSIHANNQTYLDFNRAGVPLMEIVTEPDLRSAEEAAEFLRELRLILMYIGCCDGDMESGSLRCDVNISVRKMGEEKLGTRVEVKNLNSTRYILQAINHEVKRQIASQEAGKKIEQETRLFNNETGETILMRKKEDGDEYRYFPDPDLLPVNISSTFIAKVKEGMEELPSQRRSRYAQLSLGTQDIEILVNDPAASEYFDNLTQSSDAKLAFNWLVVELFGYLNKNGLSISESPVAAASLAELIQLITSGKISGKIAKEIFKIMCEGGKNPGAIVQELGMVQISDTQEIAKAIQEVISNHPDKLTEFKSGKIKLFGFFVGEVMKKTKGKANPEIVNKILEEELGRN